MGADAAAATGGEQQGQQGGEAQGQAQQQGQQAQGAEGLEGALGAPAQQAANDGKWYWADGVEGKDKAPEWFDGKKYKSVAEQAKGYADARREISRMGEKLKGFTGAPEGDYELSLPDGVNAELDKDNPLLKDVSAWAKKAGLNQAAFTEMLHIYAKNEAYQSSIEPLKAALGEQANDRIKSVLQYGKANLSAEQYQLLNATALNPKVFQLVEALIGKTVQPAARLGDDAHTGSASRDDWQRKWYAKSDMPGVVYKIDEPGQREVARRELAGIVGDGNHTEVMGGKPRAA